MWEEPDLDEKGKIKKKIINIDEGGDEEEQNLR